MLKNQLLIKCLPYKVKYTPTLYTHFSNALLRPWFQCSLLKNVARWVVDFEGLKWVQAGIDCEAGLVCSLEVKPDDNWNMQICNKKQHMYFICTFKL
jgi:hypothetical protein